MTDGLVISRAALRDALDTLRSSITEHDDDAIAVSLAIDGLRVLHALLAPAPVEPQGRAVRLMDELRTFHAPTLAAEEAQPAHDHHLPDAPGDRAEASREGKAGAHRIITPERIAAIRPMWPDPRLSGKDILRRLNELPGKQMVTSGHVYAVAAAAGLPTRRRETFAQAAAADATPQEADGADDEATPLAGPQAEPAAPPAEPGPEPAATPAPVDLRTANGSAMSRAKGATLPAQDPRKVEVFEAFDSGLTVRDVAADFGIPLSTLSNWQAEWRLARKEPAA